MTAAVHRSRANIVSEQERERVMAEARANVADKTLRRDGAKFAHHAEDPVRKWKREQTELENSRAEARRAAIRTERTERRAQASDVSAWTTYIASEIAARASPWCGGSTRTGHPLALVHRVPKSSLGGERVATGCCRTGANHIVVKLAGALAGLDP